MEQNCVGRAINHPPIALLCQYNETHNLEIMLIVFPIDTVMIWFEIMLSVSEMDTVDTVMTWFEKLLSVSPIDTVDTVMIGLRECYESLIWILWIL